ncbi:hypothetical protein F0170_05580 [Pseudomonas sp. MAFF 730085]|uniref:Uncharacterized protein n=1 Tax=Pseudomonas kitaguniensis TaxID=2607908 RepID=A0A5N7JQC2_9PSED|nr:hypothetical protein [Pseudomonas kitaguniensis]MPR04302.1 hypothetical protein [Pseudomonas kitaguniensis]
MRIRGKLQNFAKAAILAITQKNCSSPCGLFEPLAPATPPKRVRFYARYMHPPTNAWAVNKNKRDYS